VLKDLVITEVNEMLTPVRAPPIVTWTLPGPAIPVRPQHAFLPDKPDSPIADQFGRRVRCCAVRARLVACPRPAPCAVGAGPSREYAPNRVICTPSALGPVSKNHANIRQEHRYARIATS